MNRSSRWRFKEIADLCSAGDSDSDLDETVFKWMLVDWEVDWLPINGDTRISNQAEAVCEWPLQSTQMTYETPEDYSTTYVPLIVHEIWAQTFARCKDRAGKGDQTFSFNLMNAVHKETFTYLYGEDSFRTTRECFYKCEEDFRSGGNMILVQLPCCGEVFGYIMEKRVQTESEADDRFITVHMGFLIKIKKTEVFPDNIHIACRHLVYIKPFLRHVEAVFSLKSQPLCYAILRPYVGLCQIEGQPIDFDDQFSESQKQAIKSAVHLADYSDSNILLIQGPPGTGKTQTLVGMVKQIYLNWWRANLPKILICAPSNGAADEITRRLIEIRGCLTVKHATELKMVRVGIDNNISEDCREVSLKWQAERKKKEFEVKVKELEKEIARLRLSFEPEKQEKKEVELENLKNDFAKKNIKSKKTGDGEVLEQVHVIISTLNSCQHKPVRKAMAKKRFDLAIVDEAGQCCEPEVLMAIQNDIRKLILVGDHKQLPATVVSEMAVKHGYGQSLFERFYQFFAQQDDNPIVMLNQQFRMHPDICKFPSDNFYLGQLVTCQSVSQRSFPLRPYNVFDLIDTDEDRDNTLSAFNVGEADFVVKLLLAIDQILSGNRFEEIRKSTVGVITPYQGQRRVIEAMISRFYYCFQIQIDVNTVDGFQGRERDVVIISLVRSAQADERRRGIGFVESPQRMNVALTRARHKLVVVGSFSTLQMDNKWKRLVNNSKKRLAYTPISSGIEQEELVQFL